MSRYLSSRFLAFWRASSSLRSVVRIRDSRFRFLARSFLSDARSFLVAATLAAVPVEEGADVEEDATPPDLVEVVEGVSEERELTVVEAEPEGEVVFPDLPPEEAVAELLPLPEKVPDEADPVEALPPVPRPIFAAVEEGLREARSVLMSEAFFEMSDARLFRSATSFAIWDLIDATSVFSFFSFARRLLMAFLSDATCVEDEVGETEDEGEGVVALEVEPLPEEETEGGSAAVAAPAPMKPQRAVTVPATVTVRMGFILFVFIVLSLQYKVDEGSAE